MLSEFEDGMHYMKSPDNADVNPFETHPEAQACGKSGLNNSQIWGYSFAGSIAGALMSLIGAVLLIPTVVSGVKLNFKHATSINSFAVSSSTSFWGGQQFSSR